MISAALGLGIVTSPLAQTAKKAAHAGTLGQLRSAEVAAFTGGYRVALAVLAGLTLAAAAASVLRRSADRAPAAQAGSTGVAARRAR